MATPVYYSASGAQRPLAQLLGRRSGRALPTGNARDLVDGLWVTCVDVGRPMVLLDGNLLPGSSPEPKPDPALPLAQHLQERLERVRLQTGYLMGLGDVMQQPVPHMLLVRRGGPATLLVQRLDRSGSAVSASFLHAAAAACALAWSDSLTSELLALNNRARLQIGAGQKLYAFGLTDRAGDPSES